MNTTKGPKVGQNWCLDLAVTFHSEWKSYTWLKTQALASMCPDGQQAVVAWVGPLTINAWKPDNAHEVRTSVALFLLQCFAGLAVVGWTRKIKNVIEML